MTKLVLHPDTDRLVRQFTNELPHALLLEGAAGSGLTTLARHIAGHDLANIIQPTAVNGETAEPGKGEIRITQIRELVTQTRGKATHRRCFIIDDADLMNTSAQNAFLKLLEEPAAAVHFILTAHNPQQLLPTVRSRVQSLLVKPISQQQSQKLIDSLGSPTERQKQQILFLADGKPAEIARLLTTNRYFDEHSLAVTDAKQFLNGTLKERIHVAHTYHSNAVGAQAMLTQAMHMLEFSLKQRPSKEGITAIDRLATIHEQIGLHGNVRLLLLSFVL